MIGAYLIIFAIWYITIAIGVGKSFYSAYDEDTGLVFWGGLFWPITLIFTAFWG